MCILVDPLLLKGSVVSSSDDSAFIHFSNNERFGNSFSLSSGLVFPIADKNTMIFNEQNFEASYAEEISSSYSSSESDLHDSNYAQSNEA